MKTQRNGGCGRDSGGDDSDSGDSGGSASTGSGSPGIQDEEKRETYPVVRFADLHTDSTAKDISELFRGIGRIKWFSMLNDYKGNFVGEAEVAYERNSNAHKAVRELHNKDFKGKPLTVTIVEVFGTIVDVFGSQKGFSRTDTSPADSESEPETGKGEGKKRKKSSDEEEDDPDSEKATKQPRGIKIG